MTGRQSVLPGGQPVGRLGRLCHAARSRFGRIPRHYLAAAGVMVVLAALLDHDWDGFVFRTATVQFLHGQSPYDVAAARPYYSFLGVEDQAPQWYAYPPLPILLMAATSWPALLGDLPAFAVRVLLKLPMVAGTLLLAWSGGRWGARLGLDLRGVARLERAFLWNPYLLLVGAAWGMTDTLLVFFLLEALLAADAGRPARAGVLAALSVLVKPFGLLVGLPILVLLAARRGRGFAARLAAAGAATGAAACLPFLLANPAAFWAQVAGFHLARPVQGFSVWSLPVLQGLPPALGQALPTLLLAAGILALCLRAPRLRSPAAPLVLLTAAACLVLLLNRVVNEQYLVLAVAPFLVLAAASPSPALRRLAAAVPLFFALVVAVRGFHFLTFLPPDVAMTVLRRPVDEAAEAVRAATPWLWAALDAAFTWGVPAALVALLAAFRRELVALRRPPPWLRAPAAVACVLVALLAAASPLVARAESDSSFHPAYPEPKVAAFYYLWWQNPSHDPAIEYGNWFGVSQHPEMGAYTNTRGVHRDHAAAMVGAGIDTAIVSYHRSELARYRSFQEEAAKAGLRVAPLIELNNVYDQPRFHPVDETGALVPYAAYRLTPEVRDAVVEFVLDLEPMLRAPSALRLGERPAVYFYDSYVSGVSYHPEDKRALAEVLWSMRTPAELRDAFQDPGLAGPEDLLPHHPPRYADFAAPGPAALWRAAHLEQHARFWQDLRLRLEARLGPLHLVGGDAFNERAGFEAGTAKNLVSLQVMDGSFVYSPSFTWGSRQGEGDFNATFVAWEDRNAWLAAFARGAGRSSTLGVAPAYDDTVLRPRGFRIPADGGGGSFYLRSWDSAVQQRPGLVAVATWNEFFEGSGIEPSLEFGDRFVRETAGQRERLAAPDATSWVALVPEVASRVDPGSRDLTEAHNLTLGLVASASRLQPSLAAVDTRAPGAPEAASLLLVEGGQAGYAPSPAVQVAVARWRAAGVPAILFGPEAPPAFASLVPEACRSGLRPPADPSLRPGDQLVTVLGQLTLLRDGALQAVGRDCGNGVAYAVLKPWGGPGGPDSVVGSRCLDTAIAALVRSEGRSRACVVPA